MLKHYFVLTKPGIIFGNLITCSGGFALASKGEFDLGLLLITLLGLGLVVAAGCVSNNYVDRTHDAKMDRTKNRPLVKGEISPKNALRFATLLLLSGTLLLMVGVNRLVVLLSLIGFVIYLIFYSFSKYRTVHATLIGSVAGAIPPIVGYAAASQRLDLGALILFLMIALWQMPHFYAIAMYRLDEYASASIPVLPLIRGLKITKVHMLLYILGFLAVSLLLPLFNSVGSFYFITTATLGLLWLAISIKGFRCANDKVWARRMFFCSLAVVMGACISISFSS